MSVLDPHILLATVSQFSAKRVVLALSGGLDSMVLLELLFQARQLQNFELEAVYVNHGLSQNAVAWSDFCQQQCQQRNVTFSSVAVKLDGCANIEAQAREARYQALAETVTDQYTLLMTAHHADDQLETLLLALKRGAGATGLSGIAPSRPFAEGLLVRPLLAYSRQQLQRFASSFSLQWIEDESNADNSYDRNFLRNQIIPQLTERWPALVQTASRSMQHVANLQQLTDEHTEQLMSRCVSENRLLLSQLKCYSDLQQDLIIRRWLAMTGLNPQTSWLETLKQQVIAAREDATPLLQLSDYQIRRFDQALYLLKSTAHYPAGTRFVWQGDNVMSFPTAEVALYFSAQPLPDSYAVVVPEKGTVEIVFGRFNLPFKPAGYPMSKPLKQWLKLWKISPWQRLQLPLVLIGGQLMIVPGYAIADITTPANLWIQYKSL